MVYSNGIPIIEPIYWTHDTWTAACADLFMDDHTPYKNINVINGNGYEVKLKYPDGLLSWLSSQGYNESTKPEEDDKPGSSGGNFKPLVGNIFQKIFELFRRMIAIIMG